MDVNFALCSPRQSSGQNPQNPVLVQSPRPRELPSNHVLIKVERFGFSANNITYQALGEHSHFRYFDFHPAPETTDVSPKTHGLIPVWGFGTIMVSTHPKIQEGERVYGYFAPARYILVPVSPSDINRHAFYVPRPHLPADRRPYNQIIRCATDPHYSPTPLAEDLTMLYRPLFWTSYWCEDWLHASRYRGGVSFILISSASSKTAFCLAYVIRKRIRRGELDKSVRIIGLTSRRNKAFTEGLRLYDEVLEYDSYGLAESFKEGKDVRWLYVDVSGNETLNEELFSHFASPYTGSLVAAISLGLTNLSPSSSSANSINWATNTSVLTTPSIPLLPTSTSSDGATTSQFWPVVEQFFMPEWLDVRKIQLPIGEIFSRQNEAWKELMEDCTRWVQLERVHGADSVKKAYDKLTKEGLGPEKGFLWSLWDTERLVSRL